MESRPNGEETVRYLLGTLPEPEQILLEKRFFVDDERYEQMLAIEDELMYAYLQGELSSEDRARFEQRFLRDRGGRGRADFARALVQAVGSAPAASGGVTVPAAEKPVLWQGWKAPRWGGQLGLRAAALALAALSGWMTYEAIEVRKESQRLLDARVAQERELQTVANRSRQDRIAAAQSREAERQARAELERLRAEARGARSRTVVSLILASGLHRGEGESTRLVIPSTADLVRLQLDLGKRSEYQSYGAVIRTAEGDQVWGREGLHPSPAGTFPAVIVEVPAKVLPRGDYELILSGSSPAGDREEIANYYFHVVRP